MWRIEAPAVVARLTRLVGSLDEAEDLAQDAFVAAVKRWSRSGIPDNPGAWLMATARYLAIDHLRRRDNLRDKLAEVGLPPEAETVDFDEGVDDPVKDDLVRLLFMACHPVLSPEARAALTLRLFGGLTTEELARAYLITERTAAQRIVRAKRTLRAAAVSFELPEPSDWEERLGSVLEVVYLIFNEGYSATSGDDWMRTELCAEAMRIGRVLVTLVPDDPEAHGLLALMELQASRSRARVDENGDPVVLLEQNRGLWDHLLIGRGLQNLAKAEALGGALGPYALEAAIAGCHARARVPEDTDWGRIAALYDALSRVAPSPVVEVNRAVALGMAFGPSTGLELADELLEVPALRDYHLLPAVRGELLERMGRHAEAAAEFARAASLTRNAREQTVLRGRAERAQENSGDVSI